MAKSRLQLFSSKFSPLTAEEIAQLDADIAADRAAEEADPTLRAERERVSATPGLNWAWLSEVAANNPSGFDDAETDRPPGAP